MTVYRSGSASGTGFDRREFLRRGTSAVGVLSATGAMTALAGCGGDSSKEVNMLAWPGHGVKWLVDPFEKATGIKVNVKEYADGDQMVALATTSPPGSFDVLMLDPELSQQLLKADALMPLDPADFPVADREFLTQFRPSNRFPVHWYGGKMYAVAWAFSFQSLSYNTDQFAKSDLSSYEVLWSEKAKGKVGWLDWWMNGLGPISMYLGNSKDPFNISNEQFAKLKDTLFSLKKQTKGLYSIGEAVESLATAQIWLAPGGGKTQTVAARLDGKPVGDAIPKEGAVQYTESLSIFNGAKNLDNAKKWINYCISAEGCARKALLPAYQGIPVNEKSWQWIANHRPKMVDLLEINLKGPNILDNVEAGRVALRRLPENQPIEQWQQLWTEFKAL